jgi:uncharacterized protein YndB with AHSA1/START domain
MASAASGPGLTLKVKRTFQAPIEKVWEAWAQPKQLEHWMCRDKPEHRTKYRELEFRKGGRYLIENTTPGGVYLGSGTYEDIKPLEKIVFTWSWEHEEGTKKTKIDEPTRVTVEFRKRGDATEVLLTHELLPNEAQVKAHEEGWTGCFVKLADYLESR